MGAPLYRDFGRAGADTAFRAAAATASVTSTAAAAAAAPPALTSSRDTKGGELGDGREGRREGRSGREGEGGRREAERERRARESRAGVLEEPPPGKGAWCGFRWGDGAWSGDGRQGATGGRASAGTARLLATSPTHSLAALPPSFLAFD